MAKIAEIKLKKATNWRSVAADALALLDKDEPRPLTKAERELLIERYTPKADVGVTMHTRLSYDEGQEYTRQQEKLRKETQTAKNRKQDGGPDATWHTISFFVKDWTLTDADTGEALPFTREGLGKAELNEVFQIVELCDRVANGVDPNG